MPVLNCKQSTLLQKLKGCPLIASVQARDGSQLSAPEHLLPMAVASLAEGVQVLRLEGVAEGAGAGSRYIGQHAIESSFRVIFANIGVDDLNVVFRHALS